MAKKRRAVKTDFADNTTQEIISKYGNVIKSGVKVFEESENLQVIPVSPAIDQALGGGIKEGSWVIFTGDPKTGKTTTALQFAATCQKEEWGGRTVIYSNAEGRLKSMNLGGVEVLDLSPEKFKIEQSEDEPLSAEEFLSIAEQYIRETPECVVVVDSISSLIPEKELTGELTAFSRALLPRLLGSWTKKLATVVPAQRATVVMITHFIANTSGYGKMKMSDGGNKIRYQVDTHMEVKRVTPWEVAGEQIGQMLTWKVICSGSGGFPGAEAESWLRYGTGIDNTQELIHQAMQMGLIDKGGGGMYRCDYILDNKEKAKEWFVRNEVNLEDEEATIKAVKFKGQEKLYVFLSENEDMANLLREILGEMI